jgi:lysophospholipase L1-like esterase
MALSYPMPNATGGMAPVTITCTPPPGSMFPSGSSAVTCTAVDGGGRSATCGFTINVNAVPRLTRTRFMTFGDSLTEGKISLTRALLVDSPAHSYPAKLLRLLKERYTGQEITVINEGFGGERADESFSRFRDALSQHRPEAVLLMHGVNDLNGTHDGRVQLAADAMEELVKEARNRGSAPFVATLPPLGPGGKAACPECVEPYNSLVRRMAAAKGATLVDVHAAWGGRPGLMGADGIHPSEAGYEVIATAFFDAIKRTLESPAGKR